MRAPTNRDPFLSIDPSELSQVSGGASRVTARSTSSNDQLTAMMTQITSSLQALSQNNNQSDPMQMMMMMMMMGGMGGAGGAGAGIGGGGPVAAGPGSAPSFPPITISTSFNHNGR